MQAAKDLGVAVKGVSFHVGSGATDPEAFREAIQLGRGAFDAGAGVALIHLLPLSCLSGQAVMCSRVFVDPATALT